MNITPFIDTPFDDDDAWEAFTLSHGMAHEKYYEVMFAAGYQFPHYPVFDLSENADWKLIHQQEHDGIFRSLGLTGLPDLATVDLSKQDEFEDWLAYHGQVHARINAALGITS